MDLFSNFPYMAYCPKQLIETTWKIPNFSKVVLGGFHNPDKKKYMSSIHRHVLFNGVFSKDASVEHRIKVEAVVSLFHKKFWFTICLNDRSNIPPDCFIRVGSPVLRIILHKNDATRKVEINGLESFSSIDDNDVTTVLFHLVEMDNFLDGKDKSLNISFRCYFELNHLTGYFHHRKELPVCGQEALNDFEGLLKDTSTADVVIKASLGKVKSFHCHKLVLAARSPIFRAMFESQMKETQENVVEVQDISAQGMDHFLYFIYCGRFQDSSWIQSIPQLVNASEKYCVESLKEMCDSHLIQCVTDRNALTLAKLAERHELINAAKDIRQFIAKHIGNVNLGVWTSEDSQILL